MFEDQPYCLVMQGGDKDLQDILDEQGSMPLPENQVRFIFECVAQAVHYCHSLSLVHHDLKVSHSVVRNIDFA